MVRGGLRQRAGLALAATCFVLLATTPGLAARGDGNDRVAFGETITVSEGQTAEDIVCAFCTVRVRGDVSGDVVTFFGTTEVAEGKTIAGDLVVFGGGLKLDEGSKLQGDLVLFGGSLEQAEGAVIHGDRVALPGSAWLLVLLLPLLVPIGVIWLVVTLLRRSRYRFPAYPDGRWGRL